MSMAYACDQSGCDSHQKTSQARAGWLTVHELGTEAVWHFCSADCLLLFFGQRPAGEDLTPGQRGVDTP